MATDSLHRRVCVERTHDGKLRVSNERDGAMMIGTGDGPQFTPQELLLAAIGGCTALDVDPVTSRRAEPDSFEVTVEAEKVRDGGGNHLTGIEVTFRVRFPAGEGGDEARAMLPGLVHQSHDRLCTVSRTVELGTPVATRID